MKHKRESFRWRLMMHNIMLLVMVAVGGTMYFLLNDDTINSYNDTFASYNELNQFYGHIKDMNETFETYHESGVETYWVQMEQAYENSKNDIIEIQDHVSNPAILRKLIDLNNMLQQYHSTMLNTKGSSHTVSVHERYLDFMRSRGNYYEAITQDMQNYKDAVNKNRTRLGWMSAVLIIFMILWIVYFSYTMINSITGPIEKIIHNMNLIKKGEYDLTQISNTNEEMNVLCLALEDMAENVQKNIQYTNEKAELEKRVLEQENENLKKDELLAQGELRILQNQINPHFLFNTLNMIYKKAYSEGAYETSELMEKTSQLLRYSLDNSNKVSSLKEELKAVENYMFIQDKRFGERIHFTLEYDSNIQNIKMPTMILQPLVENAVVHGLKDTMEEGEVLVNVSQNALETIVSISDNGKGMSTQKLEELILNDYQVRDDVREHIGLYNVTRRLKMFYGDHVSMIINTDVECGFEIVIKIFGEVQA